MKSIKFFWTKKPISVLAFALLLLNNVSSYGQCTVQAFASSVDIICGETVKLSALGNQENIVFTNDFATCPGNGWMATSAATCTNPCGPGPTGAADQYLWMGSGSIAPRALTSNPYDVSRGATICFDMKYAAEEGCTTTPCPTLGTCDCEGPDLPTEGVHLQYNTGAGWFDIDYWDPNGGCDPILTRWTNYCRAIPNAAFSTNTQFRWFQDVSDGNETDHWGLDNIKISVPSPNYLYDWDHDAQAASQSSNTPDVTPITTTTYNVTYSSTDGSVVCKNSIKVNVVKAKVFATADPTVICPGDQVDLESESELKTSIPESCGVTNDITCDPLSDEAGEFTLGNGNFFDGYNNGGFDYDLFGDFGYDNVKVQVIIRPNELKALGFDGGRIRSIAYDVPIIYENGSNTRATQLVPNLRIYMGCMAK